MLKSCTGAYMIKIASKAYQSSGSILHTPVCGCRAVTRIPSIATVTLALVTITCLTYGGENSGAINTMDQSSQETS